MSTNQQRLKSAIQRIARSDPQIRSLLKAVEARGDIPATGAAASNNAEQERQCCDGSVSGGGGGSSGGGSDATVGTSTRTPDGSQTGLDGDNSADLGDMGGGSLEGLTDCETGQPVTFDGSDWVPPEGWDDPTDPPVDPDYEEGFYWIGYWNGSGTASLSFSVAKGASCGRCGDCPSTNNTFVGGGECNGGDDRWAVDAGSCPGHPVCDDPIPLAMHWPSDGTVHLAAKNGAIVGSKFDPENDGTYSKGKSEISLCDENGNEVNIKPSASGGWKSMDYSRPGDGFLYDGTGKQIARISGSEYSDPNI